LKNRSVAARLFSSLLLTVVALALTACGQIIYNLPNYNFAGRPTPPSQLQQRVMASYTANGSAGGLEILDGLRDLRSNVQNTITTFFISSYSGGYPSTIINYPEESRGYVFSVPEGSLTTINYGTEQGIGAAATFNSLTPSVAAASDGSVFAGASEATGQLIVTNPSLGSYALNLPNVDKVVLNNVNGIILAMVRNSDTLYRVVKLNTTAATVAPPGAVDCQPLLLPVYCVVPVAGPVGTNPFDRPSNAYFSADGSTVYVLNCGPECGGIKAGVVFLQASALAINNIPTVDPTKGGPSPLSVMPTGITNPVLIPGGVTAALSDGTQLYLAGQQLQTSGMYAGLFAGELTTLNLTTFAVSSPISISDGHHSKMLFADDNTLWIGSQQCANGVRAATANYELQHVLTQNNPLTDEAANYNCLTRVLLGTATLQPHIVPAVYQLFPGYVPPPPPAVPVTATPVSFPNTNQNPFYYGDLSGICWVQEFHKVFTAYGGQIHVFYTGGKITDGSDPAVNTQPAAGAELNNFDVTVQGTVLDVAYMDALTNAAN
jgi:hypothetical protein